VGEVVVSSAATRGKARAGDEILIDGTRVTLWSPAPRPNTWWGLDDDGHVVYLVNRRGVWERSGCVINLFRPGDRVQVRGYHHPPLIGTVTSTYYRGSCDQDAMIFVHLDGRDRISHCRASRLFLLGPERSTP
jgi:hypothetical protein